MGVPSMVEGARGKRRAKRPATSWPRAPHAMRFQARCARVLVSAEEYAHPLALTLGPGLPRSLPRAAVFYPILRPCGVFYPRAPATGFFETSSAPNGGVTAIWSS